MTARTNPATWQAPEWIPAEMPPGYQTRLVEIQRLSDELYAMDRVGRVLWETGEALRGSVGELFAALRCEADVTPGSSEPIVVKLGDARRLLLVVSDAASPLQKADEQLARAFQAVQRASADDRVVLVANNEPAARPAERPEPLLPDALDVLQRIGVGVVTTATLFRLWRLSFEDSKKARQAIDRLHAQDGGMFVLPPR
jgi:hypothetical protein